MVAAATLLSTAMTTTTATRALISSSCKDWQQQQQCENNNLTIKQTHLNKNMNNNHTKMRTEKTELNGEQDQQQQHNGKADMEEIDCKQTLIDTYEGETSNNSSDCKLFRWTPESTRLMLKLRFERQVEFQMRNRQKKDLWAEIANEMRKEGNFYTIGEVCDLKYRNMLQTYKKNFLKEERGMQSQIVWEYYELFKEAMKACAAVGDDLVPSQLCDTICENDDDFMEVKTELDSNNEYYNASESIEVHTTSKENINDEEVEMSNMPSKRRAPSARVQANNSKRSRPVSLNSQVDMSIVPPVNGPPPIPPPLGTEMDWTRLPPLEPKPNATTAMARNPASPPQHSTTIQSAHFPPQQPYLPIQNQQYPIAPPWLTDSELREYFSYGESVGLQIAHIRDPRTRAFLQLKIQETLFLAKVDKLTE